MAWDEFEATHPLVSILTLRMMNINCVQRLSDDPVIYNPRRTHMHINSVHLHRTHARGNKFNNSQQAANSASGPHMGAIITGLMSRLSELSDCEETEFDRTIQTTIIKERNMMEFELRDTAKQV